MKILMVSPFYPPQGGGAEVSTMLECRELIDNGVNVVLVTNNILQKELERESLSKKLKIYRVPMNFTSFIYPKGKPFGEFLYWTFQRESWKYISKLAIKERVDLIHISHAYTAFDKSFLKIPIVLTIRDLWPVCIYRSYPEGDLCCAFKYFIGGFPCRKKLYINYGVKRIPHLLYNMLFTPTLFCLNRLVQEKNQEKVEQVDQIVVISNFLKKSITRNLKINENKVEVIYPPARWVRYVPRKNHENITYTYIGRLDFTKGVVNLLRAFHIMVRRTSRKTRLLIVGDGELYGRLNRYISRYNLSKNVLLIGRIPHSRIPEVFKDTDVVVVPSLLPEGFGRVALEALLAGRIVVVNPVGGLKELIDDGINGFYVNCNDINELANKLLEITSLSKDEILSMGIKARKYTLVKKFDPNERVQKLLRIYQRLCLNK